MESGRDRDKKGTEKGQPIGDRIGMFGGAGQFVTVDRTDLARVLGDDSVGFTRAAFQRLCGAGCDPLTLTYILKVIRERLPNPWCAPCEESDRQTQHRRDDADALDRAASIIENRYAPFFPSAKFADERNQEIVSLDDFAAQMGGLGPVRLAAGLRSFATRLREPELMHEAGLLRWNQDDFDMISRYVLCAYVHRTTGHWNYADAAELLTAVGNHKPTRPDSMLDAKALRQWRGDNFNRFNQFCSFYIDMLTARPDPDVESPPSK